MPSSITYRVGKKHDFPLRRLMQKPLLILEEMTNNFDLETREHVMNVLKAYPGALITISHDEDFLRDIKVEDYYLIATQE